LVKSEEKADVKVAREKSKTVTIDWEQNKDETKRPNEPTRGKVKEVLKGGILGRPFERNGSKDGRLKKAERVR